MGTVYKDDHQSTCFIAAHGLEIKAVFLGTMAEHKQYNLANWSVCIVELVKSIDKNNHRPK